MPVYLQAPGEIRDLAFDWSDRLDDVGSPQDTIATSTWSVLPDAGSPSAWLDPQPTVNNCTIALLQSLTRGEVYTVINVITTAQGRTHERRATVRCDLK